MLQSVQRASEAKGQVVHEVRMVAGHGKDYGPKAVDARTSKNEMDSFKIVNRSHTSISISTMHIAPSVYRR
jgi:hypothetical protein